MEKQRRFEELVKSMPWAGFEEIYKILREECENKQKKWDLDINRYTLLETFLFWVNEERIECPACGTIHYRTECEVKYTRGVYIYRTPCGATLEVGEKEVLLCPVCLEPSEDFKYEFDEENTYFKVKLSCGHIVNENTLSKNIFLQKEVRLKKQ